MPNALGFPGHPLSATPGEIVGIIGPNGAGKTTLLDVISGFIAADAGRMLLSGRDLTGLGPDRRARLGLGRSFQDALLFPALTVEETIAVALERWVAVKDAVNPALHLPAAFDSEQAVRKRVTELIDMLGLEATRTKFVRELSTGVRRVVDLACVVAHSPSVVLLDEPSSGIAQRESEALAPLLLRLRDELGATLLLIEHDMPLITAVADRLVALDRGLVIAAGPPAAVLRDPVVISSYLGENTAAIGRSANSAKRSRGPRPPNSSRMRCSMSLNGRGGTWSWSPSSSWRNSRGRKLVMMLMSWPTLMKRPRSLMIAASMRRALRRCLASVTRSSEAGLRKRRVAASAT